MPHSAGWLLAAVTAMFLPGGCSQATPDRNVRITRGYVYYLDGAGGGSILHNWSGGVRDGLLDAGYAGAGEMFKWNTGLGVVADQNSSVEYKKKKASELAREIQSYQSEHPESPVTLIGLSAGTAVTVFTLEALPVSASVNDVILLGASISADYDLSRALQRVQNRMYVFTSEKDAVLAFLVPMAGTADRSHSASAGLRGFDIPPGASDETRSLYSKVAHIAWRREFAASGDFGGHTDTVKAPFVKRHIAPLVMSGVEHRIEPAPAVASGAVLNPDYSRWASHPVGSSITLEGHQVENGVKQPVRMTVQLVSKLGDRIVVERSYFFARTAQPQRVQQFIAEAEIRPEEHPFTHPRAVIRDLPDERMTVGNRTLVCRGKSVECADTFVDWGRDVTCTVRTSEEIPGGLAMIALKAVKGNEPFEFEGRVVATSIGARRLAGQ